MGLAHLLSSSIRSRLNWREITLDEIEERIEATRDYWEANGLKDVLIDKIFETHGNKSADGRREALFKRAKQKNAELCIVALKTAKTVDDYGAIFYCMPRGLADTDSVLKTASTAIDRLEFRQLRRTWNLKELYRIIKPFGTTNYKLRHAARRKFRFLAWVYLNIRPLRPYLHTA